MKYRLRPIDGHGARASLLLAVTAATKGGMAALFGVGMLLVATNATLQPDEMNLWEGLMRA